MSEVQYTARFRGPVILEKGRANLVRCPVYHDDLLVSPTGSGTLTVYNAASMRVLDGVTATLTDSIAQRSIAAGDVESQSYSDAWRLEWALPMPDGVTHTFRAFGSLVYRKLYPVVTSSDLTDRHHDLDRRRQQAKLPSFQSYLDAAWAEAESRLVKSGKRPFLILDPSALFEPHLFLTLAMIFDDFASTGESNDAERGGNYRQQYRDAWAELTFPQATPEGTPDGAGRRRSGPSTIWLCGRG